MKKGRRKMEQAKVQSELCSEELRVVLSGEIDHHSAVGVREAIDRDLFFFRPKKTVLDLSGVGFMDSSGLGLILGRYTKLKEWGGKLVIRDPTPEISKILRLAGVERLIAVERSGQSGGAADNGAAVPASTFGGGRAAGKNGAPESRGTAGGTDAADGLRATPGANGAGRKNAAPAAKKHLKGEKK